MGKKVTMGRVCRIVVFLTAISVLLISLKAPLFGQTPTPNAGLQVLALIPMPGWATLPNTLNGTDLANFDPARRVMYVADRVAHGGTAIDTTTFGVVGSIVPPGVPGCLTATVACNVSSAHMVPDVGKLVITTREAQVYIYDLRLGGPPTVLATAVGGDETDYDPIRHRLYFGVGDGVVAIDMISNKYLGKINLPNNGSAEQPRFNPNDGFIYQSSPGDGSALGTNSGQGVFVIDPSQGAAGAIVNFFPVPPACLLHANDLDPITNYAFLGCSSNVPTAPTTSMAMNLTNGSLTTSIPADGNDLGRFNANTRRWYMIFGNSTHSESGCSAAQGGNPPLATNPPRWPVLAVIAANTSSAGGAPTFVGFTCLGRGAHAIGVDPITNNIYVAVSQYPNDINNAGTGQAGILVLHDPAADAAPVPTHATATLAAVGGSGVTGTVDITLRRRNMEVDATLNGLPAGAPLTNLVVTTTVGNEVVYCGVNGTSGQGFCAADVVGNPLNGGLVDVSFGGKFVAQGKITVASTLSQTITIDSADPAQQ